MTNDDSNDLFGMQLNYEQAVAVNGTNTTTQFNGNISSMQWSSNNLKDPAKQKIYGFAYDPLNRLAQSTYASNNAGTWNAEGTMYNEALTYDRNGNILSLNRNSLFSGVSTPIDQLAYVYTSGNQLTTVTDNSAYWSQADNNPDYGYSEVMHSLNTEYTFDANGNMTSDLNTGITGLTYNYLNKPVLVTLSSPTRTVQYTFDATGTKLKKVATQGSPVSQSDYVGGVQYENGALAFMQTPDGRVVKNGSAWNYEYYLQDHLGNNRVVFAYTNNTDEYKATMEIASQSAEEAQFKNLPATRAQIVAYNHTSKSYQTPTPDRVAETNGYTNKPIGPSKFLQVKAGDQINAEAYARYTTGTSGSTAIITNLVAAVTGAYGIGTGEAAYAGFTNNLPAIAGALTANPSVPKAYLIYILFSNNFGSYQFGYQMVSVAAQAGLEKLTTTVTVPAGYDNGYLYIYVANESNVASASSVYFDDVYIKHIKATLALQVTQVTDYYPFGLAINPLGYQKSSSFANKYLYNGKEFQSDFSLNWLDYGARMYMPEIGRWGMVDPMADSRLPITPYNYVQNNPMNRFDPNGLTDYTLDKKTGDVKKAADTKDDTDRIVQTRKDGSIKRKGEGFLGGLVRESKRGEAKTAVGGIEKGILKDGQNFKNKDEVISVGGEGQASVDGVKSFTLKLSEYVGKEIKGFSYSSDASGNATDMVLGKYKDNTNTESYGTLGALQKQYGGNFSVNNVLQEFHTHPDGKLGATESSPGLSKDVRGLHNDKPFIPNASFIILYRILGQEKPGEYDYTHH